LAVNGHRVTREERAELRSILSRGLADLPARIAGSHSPDLRAALQRQECLLKKLLRRLA
jgi:hypothetical protein